MFAQRLPGVRPPLPNVGWFVVPSLAMSCKPMEFSQVNIGDLFDTVGKVLVFDLSHSSHQMQLRNSEMKFAFEGFLTGEYQSFTLFNVCLRQQFPTPVVVSTKDTVILGHHTPTWDALHSVIDLCSGFGGLAQGATAAGFEVVTAVDQNSQMVSLHSKAHGATGIVGDFGMQQTIVEIWKASKGAAVVSSGFSCQPYSSLGDGRGADDSRSNCLTKTLNAAICLHAYAVILECVAPAAQDSFVKAEVQKFCSRTGFTCSQTELRLDHVWPCRRQRAWWLLTAPEIGDIKLFPWKPLHNLWEVQQIIPEIRLWDANDEQLLKLNDEELEAFGVNANLHAKHLLNAKGVAPCALHAWGSQLRACPCGCRQYGFSTCRLESKGLHGCLVRSAVQTDGQVFLRHIHPNEAMGLNTMDPVLDFGENVSLTLSAVGQLACPIQALWIFGFLAARLDELQRVPAFSPDAQIQAYRSWLLMRCRQVWPSHDDLIVDGKLTAMMGFWKELPDLSIAELVFPMRWEGKIEGPVHIASVLDFLIRTHETIPATIHDASCPEDPPTPWMDCPSISDDISMVGCLHADSCTVVFEDSEDSPIRFQPKCCATVSQFLHAHAKLVETLDVESITLNGKPITPEHVMEVGQLIVIRTHKIENNAMPGVDPHVSPTAEWTQPVQDPIEAVTPPKKVARISKFDVGECTLPTSGQADQPWLDATPFIMLQGEQFLKLSPPSVTNTQQLWSVRHQFFRSADRLKILESQKHFWADDEIRFHLHGLTAVFRDHQLKGSSPIRPLCVIDPLIFTSWVAGKGFDCKLWARDHPEILQSGIPIVTVVLIDQHWIPVFMTPSNRALRVFTWDKAEAPHDGLQQVIETIAVSLGFESALIQRDHRMFFTSDLCGALAIAYLRDALVGSQLPTDCHEAEIVHDMLRAKYVSVLQKCDIVDRPWVWGAGDSKQDEPSSSSSAINLPDVSLTRDQRIDLINEKGMEMADDEIRFHLLNLIDKQPVTSTLLGRTFNFIEPLVYNCWNSIGKIIIEQWCEKNRNVSIQGVNVITAFSIDGHWVPLWFSPRSTVLQVHLVHAEGSDFAQVESIVSLISSTLGFLSFTMHWIPDSLPEHQMCGAFAMCFLAHVVMGMPLPTDLRELRTLQTNMRASFVAHLYSHDMIPRPVVWGLGKKAENTSSHRTYDDASECELNHWQLAQPSEAPLPPGLVHSQTSHTRALQTPQVGGKESASSSADSAAYASHTQGGQVSHPKQCPVSTDGYRNSKPADKQTWPEASTPSQSSAGNDPFAAWGLRSETVPAKIAILSHGPEAMPSTTHVAHASLTPCTNSKWESGPLPIMPVTQTVQADHANARSDFADNAQVPVPPETNDVHNQSGDTDAKLRQERLLQITSHSYAMADDEMQYQLQHLLQCHHVDDFRKFMCAPCLGVFQWTIGEPAALDTWIREQWTPREDPNTHLLVALLVEWHWIPVWFAPTPHGLHAHTLANFASDEPLIDSVLHLLAAKLGLSLSVIHRAPHGVDCDRLCGVMTLSFFAHILLRTAMPSTREELYARCWKMKETFADSLRNGPVSQPTAWGWGRRWECRPLPIMPAWPDVCRCLRRFLYELLGVQANTIPNVVVTMHDGGSPAQLCMTRDEMESHIALLAQACPAGMWSAVVGRDHLENSLSDFEQSHYPFFGCALLSQYHWTPVIAFKQAGHTYVFVDCGADFHTQLNVSLIPVQMDADSSICCGAHTWQILAMIWSLDVVVGNIRDLRTWLSHQIGSLLSVGSPIGYAPHGQLIKNLCAELSKHGVPDALLEDRAQAALKALGSEQLLTALNHRQPWRQLKALGNNSRFQFVLPNELAQVVAMQKGKPVVKGKGKGKTKSKTIPQPIDLDPAKLQIMDGTFRFQDKVLPQLSLKQIGPLSSGVIMMNMQDAELYLKSGKLVSQEPLALIVLHRADTSVQTSLPHGPVSVPCRCMIDNEPVLVDAVLVQVGTGHVEKVSGNALLAVDTPEVVTLKILVYKDELQGDWDEFCQSPIKCLVGLLPMLKRCFTENCQCEGWHNPEQLPLRDPIIDVWRRQFLRQGFKPCPPAQADMFSVCLRIPICLLEIMLGASGISGVYTEPRTADGKDVLPTYTVIWTPKHTVQEMKHIMQTNPAVIGLARLSERRGLRVHSAQAKTIHQLVKPDAVYLPNGPKTVYTVGPFPYGVDRQAVGRILQKAGWESRPLQPASPCPGKGVMWMVQSAEEPSQTIIPTTTGEIMIAKVKQEVVSQVVQPVTVGSAATLALCGKPAEGQPVEHDPWATNDPWKKYHPTGVAASGPSEGLQQIEDRIQTAVLAKIQPPMEQDDLPDRVQTLEGQVQQLLAKQQGLETQFEAHSTQHTQQITALQGQVTAQAQQLHGHLENQNQTMQSLFEQQMQQIRGLLAKRPRDEGME